MSTGFLCLYEGFVGDCGGCENCQVPAKWREVLDLECQMPMGECQNCGGWLHVERKGGVDGRTCGDVCRIELEFFSRRGRVSDWCPTCGFDNFEHSEECNVGASHGV